MAGESSSGSSLSSAAVLPVYFHPAGKRTLPSLVSFDLGKYKLLSPFLHGDYPGSADDRLFPGGLSFFFSLVEKSSAGAFMLSSVNTSGDFVYQSVREESEDERTHKRDNRLLE